MIFCRLMPATIAMTSMVNTPAEVEKIRADMVVRCMTNRHVLLTAVNANASDMTSVQGSSTKKLIKGGTPEARNLIDQPVVRAKHCSPLNWCLDIKSVALFQQPVGQAIEARSCTIKPRTLEL